MHEFYMSFSHLSRPFSKGAVDQMVEPHPVLIMKGTQLKHSSIIEGYIAQILKNAYFKDNTLGPGCIE